MYQFFRESKEIRNNSEKMLILPDLTRCFPVKFLTKII